MKLTEKLVIHAVLCYIKDDIIKLARIFIFYEIRIMTQHIFGWRNHYGYYETL